MSEFDLITEPPEGIPIGLWTKCAVTASITFYKTPAFDQLFLMFESVSHGVCYAFRVRFDLKYSGKKKPVVSTLILDSREFKSMDLADLVCTAQYQWMFIKDQVPVENDMLIHSYVFERNKKFLTMHFNRN